MLDSGPYRITIVLRDTKAIQSVDSDGKMQCRSSGMRIETKQNPINRRERCSNKIVLFAESKSHAERMGDWIDAHVGSLLGQWFILPDISILTALKYRLSKCASVVYFREAIVISHSILPFKWVVRRSLGIAW